jgi:hypothetical protein
MNSYFSVADQEDGFSVDNGTLQVISMVISGSHYRVSYFPSQEMEEEAMEQNMNADHSVNEENMDTHVMNPSSPMNKEELIFADMSCVSILISPILTKIDQDYFPIVDRSFIEPSCSENSCDFPLSTNREYVLEDISDSNIMQEKKNHVDHFNQGEETNIQELTPLAQQYTFRLEEENNAKEESFYCETIPSVEPTDSQ